MIVNLINGRQMFSITLPDKVKGRYWLPVSGENGKEESNLSIEAVSGAWMVKSNRFISVIDTEGKPVKSAILHPSDFFRLRYEGSDERAILFAENIDPSRQEFKKLVVTQPETFYIGRTPDNNCRYENRYVSGKHARLTYDGSAWTIVDTNSTNGTYVNGLRVQSKCLEPGDLVYIMGLKLVTGRNFLAFNNPDGMLHINSAGTVPYREQTTAKQETQELPAKRYFYRSASFHREIKPCEIKIDPPPPLQKADTMPMALMLGPALTMGLASMSTGVLTVSNTLANGGDISQAIPTLVMSVSMLLGTVLWPILTKQREKKERLKNETQRQERYLAYLDDVRDEIRRKCKEQADILNENLPSPEACARLIAEEKPGLWCRAIGQSDFLRLRLGIGDLPMNGEVKYPEKKFSLDDDNLQDAMFSLGMQQKKMKGVPVGISLLENKTVGIFGHTTANENLLRALIIQMIALHSYDELKLMLITDEASAERWDFMRIIPHIWSDDRQTRFLAVNANEIKELSVCIEKELLNSDGGNRENVLKPPYYVVICTDIKLAQRCEALQQLISGKGNYDASVLLSAVRQQDLPKETRLMISTEEATAKLFSREDTNRRHLEFAVDTVNETVLPSISRDIANIELELSGQRYQLPGMLSFLEMFHVGKIEYLNSLSRWRENNPVKSLQTPIGVDTSGEAFLLDLHEKYHGPHGLVAGMTGSGKSEFIITYILSLAVNYHPDEVAFILIDYKGGGLAGAFEDAERGIRLPHLAGTITNLDGASVKRSLISIQSELRRRQAIFNKARRIANEGTMDIYKYQQMYREKLVTEPVPHLFIISDEFAELKTQQPEFMEQLISAARIGRSLGVHLILATQKPSGVVDDQIWSNSKFRVCLKVQDRADSQDMIKCSDAAEISQTGRFYLQVGFNELFALGQSAWCGADYFPAETVERPMDNSVQIVDDLGRTVLNIKPASKRASSGIKQIVGIIKYLSDLAKDEHISQRPLWLPAIPQKLYLEDLECKYGVSSASGFLDPIVGEYDDPFDQKQNVLTVPLSQDGNCLVYGSVGNGKTEFLSVLAYSLLRHHTAEDLNLYIMDFGSETLRVFEKAPQVGGVMSGNDTEKILNFLKMLHQEMELRRSLFSAYGGSYESYCRNSDRKVPNIVVLLNNFAAFAELFEAQQELFSLLTRDGVKYGIFFVVTASSTAAVRYRTQQNFKTVLTMQLNDPTDYSIVVGKTDGLIPSKYKGRGLVAKERVCEFQTAECANVPDMQEHLRAFCAELTQKSKSFARPVPVLPEVVKLRDVQSTLRGLTFVPVGIGKKSMQTAGVNLSGSVAYPIVVQDIHEAVSFVEEFSHVCAEVVDTVLVDGERILNSTGNLPVRVIDSDYESFVVSLFSEMVLRNNTFKDAKLDTAVLEPFDERVYILVGLASVLSRLSADGKEKLSLLLEKAESIYKLRFVIVDSASQCGHYNLEPWYRRQISGTDGLWLGDGIADQYQIKVNKVTSDLYEDLDSEYGYLVTRGRPVLVKLLSAREEDSDG